MAIRSRRFVENGASFNFNDSNEKVESISDLNGFSFQSDQFSPLENQQIQKNTNDYILFPGEFDCIRCSHCGTDAFCIDENHISNNSYNANTTFADYQTSVTSFNSLLDSPLDLDQDSFGSPYEQSFTTPLFNSPVAELGPESPFLYSPVLVPFELSINPKQVSEERVIKEEEMEPVMMRDDERVADVQVKHEEEQNQVKQEEETTGKSSRASRKRKAVVDLGARDAVSGKRVFNGTRAFEFEVVPFEAPTKSRYVISLSPS